MNCSDEAEYSTTRIRYRISAAFLNLLTVLVLCGVSPAAVMPDYVHLPSITDNVSGPVAVALDREGRLFVAESGAGKILVFSQSGRYLTALSGLNNPISVAVDDDGRILVGSKDNGSVDVYDSDFTPLFKLGAGNGEFSWPNDICVDTVGRIFVVDRGNDIVRMYDSSGLYTGSLGAPGNGDGQFYRPISMTIDEAAGEIIVLDRQIVEGTTKEGARVQFFTMGGAFSRGFTRNGDEEGGMVTPQGITVDTGSRIYVTDSYANAVLAYDNNGIFLGALYDLDNPMRAPLGLEMDRSNRLYVASRMGESIEVYGFEPYTVLEADPIRLEFTAKEGGPAPDPQTISIKNSGTADFDWEAAKGADWISVSAVTGTLAPGQNSGINIIVDPEGLAPGEYTGLITLATGIGSTEVAQAVLTVVPSARLAVSPASLELISETGTVPDPVALTIANTGNASMDWFMTKDQTWLKISNGAGVLAESSSEPAVVALTADVASLAAGTYNATITITGFEALASPATVDVTLILNEPAGPPGANDPGTNAGQGDGNSLWSLTGKIRGVSFKDVWSNSGSDVYVVGQKGTILHYNGTEWQKMARITPRTFYGIWGSATDNVFAVGQRGTIAHYDGNSWTIMPAPTNKNLYAVWGISATDVFAAGLGGTVLHYDGNEWSLMQTPTRKNLYGIWGSAETGFFAVGMRGTVLHYDGSEWNEMSAPVTSHLYGLWGSPATGDIYAVGREGVIIHYQSIPDSWENVSSGTADHLYAVWGESDSDLYVAGRHGTILHYDGIVWSEMTTPSNKYLYGAFGNSGSGVYAVGRKGTILYYDGNGF